MDRFEYRFVMVHAPDAREADAELEEMNDLGRDGWEAIGFSPATAAGRGLRVSTSTYVVLMKRRSA